MVNFIDEFSVFSLKLVDKIFVRIANIKRVNIFICLRCLTSELLIACHLLKLLLIRRSLSLSLSFHDTNNTDGGGERLFCNLCSIIFLTTDV